jgi:hypothetical protein
MRRVLFFGLVLFLFGGCGGGSNNSGDTSKKESLNSELKVEDVIFSPPKDIDFDNKTRMKMKREKIFSKLEGNHIQKMVESCSVSGTYEVSQDYNGLYRVVYNDCIDYDELLDVVSYYNGKVSISEDGEHYHLYNYREIPDYYNAMGDGTYYKDVSIYYHDDYSFAEIRIDGEIDEYRNEYIYEKMDYKDIVLKNNKVENSWYISGGFSDEVNCFKDSHEYRTDDRDWLIESSVEPNYLESGTLYVDNIKYVYHGDKVTVTKDGKSKTFTQQELLDALDKKRNESNCSL